MGWCCIISFFVLIGIIILIKFVDWMVNNKGNSGFTYSDDDDDYPYD